MNAAHPLLRSTAFLLDHFCEAYWMVARTVEHLDGDGLSGKKFLEAVRKRYDTGLLLGEVQRPEGNSVVTIENALNRYAEMELVELAGGRKERVVRAGLKQSDARALCERLAQHLRRSAAIRLSDPASPLFN